MGDQFVIPVTRWVSCPYLYHDETRRTWLISGSIRVNYLFNHRASCLINQQIRAVWVPVAMSCVVTNIEASGKPTAISLLVTNVVLLLIMLAGLLRLCRRGSSSYELWQFLWKQVGHW